MAVPKRRTSSSRQGKRRSHIAVKVPAIDLCPQCHSPKLAHHVCLVCGMYHGRQAIDVKSKRAT
ncbi:MAG: 50S ribosomal protein L32 [Chloroflexota bacterium]|nr:50S ribosomal protein L32 [Chloroflexota bacterium]